MPTERDDEPWTALHATVVAIGRRGLLIRGASKAGKSRLALALIDASTSRRRIRLVGDDRVLVSADGGRVRARPHPRIAGFIERRGLGIVGMPHVAEIELAGMVELGATPPGDPVLANLPVIALVESLSVAERRDRTLRWIGGSRGIRSS